MNNTTHDNYHEYPEGGKRAGGSRNGGGRSNRRRKKKSRASRKKPKTLPLGGSEPSIPHSDRMDHIGNDIHNTDCRKNHDR